MALSPVLSGFASLYELLVNNLLDVFSSEGAQHC